MRSQDDGPAGRRILSSCCTVRRRHRRAAATALSSCRKRPSCLILVPVSAQLPTLSHRSKRRLWFLRNLKAGAALVGLGCLHGLRGAAALAVVLYHYLLDHGKFASLFPGPYAVTVFFELSGLLITWLLLTEIDERGTADRRRFYLR